MRFHKTPATTAIAVPMRTTPTTTETRMIHQVLQPDELTVKRADMVFPSAESTFSALTFLHVLLVVTVERAMLLRLVHCEAEDDRTIKVWSVFELILAMSLALNSTTMFDKFEAHPSMVMVVPKPLTTIEVEVAFPVITIDPAFEGITIWLTFVSLAVHTPLTQTKSSEGLVASGQVKKLTGAGAVGGVVGFVGGHTVVVQVG